MYILPFNQYFTEKKRRKRKRPSPSFLDVLDKKKADDAEQPDDKKDKSKQLNITVDL